MCDKVCFTAQPESLVYFRLFLNMNRTDFWVLTWCNCRGDDVEGGPCRRAALCLTFSTHRWWLPGALGLEACYPRQRLLCPMKGLACHGSTWNKQFASTTFRRPCGTLTKRIKKRRNITKLPMTNLRRPVAEYVFVSLLVASAKILYSVVLPYCRWKKHIPLFTGFFTSQGGCSGFLPSTVGI